MPARRVTPAEISDLLAAALTLPLDAPLGLSRNRVARRAFHPGS
jgi:hypothetical protein